MDWARPEAPRRSFRLEARGARRESRLRASARLGQPWFSESFWRLSCCRPGHCQASESLAAPGPWSAGNSGFTALGLPHPGLRRAPLVSSSPAPQPAPSTRLAALLLTSPIPRPAGGCGPALSPCTASLAFPGSRSRPDFTRLARTVARLLYPCQGRGQASLAWPLVPGHHDIHPGSESPGSGRGRAPGAAGLYKPHSCRGRGQPSSSLASPGFICFRLHNTPRPRRALFHHDGKQGEGCPVRAVAWIFGSQPCA